MARLAQLSRRPAIVGLGCALAVAALLAVSATPAAADDVSPPATTATDTVPSEPIPTPDRAPAPTKAPTPKQAPKPTTTATHTTKPVSQPSPVRTPVTPQPVQTPVRPVAPITAIVPAVRPRPAVPRAKSPPARRTVHRETRPRAAPTTKPQPAVKRHAPVAVYTPPPLPALLHTAPARAVASASASKPAIRLILLMLGLMAVGFLALAAAPVSIIRTPAVVRLALRGRPVLGAVGLSLLGAVVILYLLTKAGA
jgi:hypothetical protein